MGVMEELDAFHARQAKLESLVMETQRHIFVRLEKKKEIIYDTLISDITDMYRIKPREAVKIIDAVLDNCETLDYDGTTIKIRR